MHNRFVSLSALAMVALTCSVSAADSAPPSAYRPPHKDLGFPVYTNIPSGKQLSGQHAPASTPALSPEEARKRFSLPEGFEMRLFASEPEVVNPVAMTWDERGRLWVVELYEYPLGAKPGENGRDRIKILEDTDGDGVMDKVTVFADGLNLATGIALGYGGVFVGQAPDFLFLEDTHADPRLGAGGMTHCDKRTVLKTGFGLDDRHELLNSFTWGPDGCLYLTHGVFTFSKVRDPNSPADTGVTMNAALARYHPRKKTFEVFSDGTSNPWGVDFDRGGNAFVSACVIDHMFHLAPGGIYVRQGGQPGNPFSYELIPSIVDHRHHMAAYSGIQVYQGNQFPEEYRGTVLIGNIHDNAVHQDRLTPNGSTFKSSFVKDFIRANDGWFMPVSTQTGPDGCLWIMDWYDRYPCYQNARADPDGVDREHGRIWRVVYTGKDAGKRVPTRPNPGMDLAKLSTADLVKVLGDANSWQRRMAQRLLTERSDPAAAPVLKQIASGDQKGNASDANFGALWTLHASGQLDESTLDKVAENGDPAFAAWAARLTGERGDASPAALARLEKLADTASPTVGLAVATACRQLVSQALTIDVPRGDISKIPTGKILGRLIHKFADRNDPVIPFMIWEAWEPKIALDPKSACDWLLANGSDTMPLSGAIARKTMRRVCDLRDPHALDLAIQFIASATGKSAALAVAALDGLLEGQRGKAMVPASPTSEFIAKLLAFNDPAVRDRAQKLGALWGDAAAMQASVNLVNDTSVSVDERIRAIQVVRQLKNDAAREAMLKATAPGNPEPVILEAIRALAEIGGDLVSERLLGGWKSFSPAVRRAGAEVLATRDRWASNLLSAIERKDIPPDDISPVAIRTLTRSAADYGMLAKRAAQVFGRVRDADKDKLKVINAKKQMILGISTPPDIEAGHEIAKKTCFVCHKLYGEGADVGPDLTGVGRSTIDALLANVIDPNQIIGAGYEMVEVETKDGRSVSGRMMENTDSRVRLLSAGPKEDVIARADVASLRVSELSVMPEGLEQMPDNDFRNLVAFILNPPGDHQPFNWKNDAGHSDTSPTKTKPAKSEGVTKKSAAAYPPIDHESVALWNPEWTVTCPDFQGVPAKLTDYHGRKNVLVTHPVSRTEPSYLERTIKLPATGKSALSFAVASHDKGDWELHVLANGSLLHKQLIGHDGERWKSVNVDLSTFAGKEVKLRLENAANDWSWEFGYWSDIRLSSEAGATVAEK